MVSGAKRLASFTTNNDKRQPDELFPKVDPAVDGADCLRDCDSCPTAYPRGFAIDEHDALYGHVQGWATHVLVATGKTDWVRDVADERGSVMEAFGRLGEQGQGPNNGRLMLSASNMLGGSDSDNYAEPTTLLVLPAFTLVEGVRPGAVPAVVEGYINHAPTTTTPSSQSPPPPQPRSVLPPEIKIRPCPHAVLILLCSQKTRDARCGQSAPLLRKEFERHLRPLGLARDLGDDRPGGVGIYFISHVGGHKYSANVMVYRRPDPFGLDGVARGLVEGDKGEALKPVVCGGNKKTTQQEQQEGEAPPPTTTTGDVEEEKDVGAAQCIWLARVRPEDCEGIVKYTVLQGKLVKPESQLRGGFDRSRGVMSW